VLTPDRASDIHRHVDALDGERSTQTLSGRLARVEADVDQRDGVWLAVTVAVSLAVASAVAVIGSPVPVLKTVADLAAEFRR
jgi:hypothetical protein